MTDDDYWNRPNSLAVIGFYLFVRISAFVFRVFPRSRSLHSFPPHQMTGFKPDSKSQGTRWQFKTQRYKYRFRALISPEHLPPPIYQDRQGRMSNLVYVSQTEYSRYSIYSLPTEKLVLSGLDYYFHILGLPVWLACIRAVMLSLPISPGPSRWLTCGIERIFALRYCKGYSR